MNFGALKNKITLMVVPDTKGTSRQVSIPIFLLYSVVIIVFLLITGNFFLGAEYITNQVSNEELLRLRSENSELINKYEKVRWNLSEIETRFKELVQKEIAIRTI
ncbi:MAG: hypothetical protein PHU88_08935, partial [candidate division Zixibacteria bacterium]|nr:hypothetical protein [candidate division Zixibacteria bacterium]